MRACAQIPRGTIQTNTRQQTLRVVKRNNLTVLICCLMIACCMKLKVATYSIEKLYQNIKL